MARLELKKLNKSFGAVNVIPSVDLEIEDGEFVVFVGPSGCGKSTLLRLIAGLEQASDGDILIDDESVIDTAAADRGVAMVFQSYALYPHMSVSENLSFGLENMRMPKAEIHQRVSSAAELLQIDELLSRRPKQLSGGQRQRVAIGRAITRDPKIFLFDEPLSNLDAELRVAMRMEITQLHDRIGNTMIYVTHDQIEAMTMADKIVVLRAGVVEQVGAPLHLYNYPDNQFVAGFIGSPRMNFVPGVIKKNTTKSVLIVDGNIQLDLGNYSHLVDEQSVTLGVRPEHFISSSEGKGLPLTIDTLEQHGASSFLHCHLNEEVTVLVHEGGQSGSQKGDVIHVAPDENHMHLFDADGKRILPDA